MNSTKTKKTKTKEDKEADQASKDRLSERLIQILRENPIFYNKKDNDYKNKDKKKNIVEGIMAELNIPTEDEVRVKMKYLRDQYTKEKKYREQESVSGAALSKRVPFKFFSEMAFIEPYLRKTQSISTMDTDEVEESVDMLVDAFEMPEDGTVFTVLAERVEDVAKDLYDDIADGFDNSEITAGIIQAEVHLRNEEVAQTGESANDKVFPDIVQKNHEDSHITKEIPKTPRRSPRKHPSSQTPASTPKKDMKSHPLAPNLPLLGEPSIDIKSKRSRIKRDRELDEKIGDMVSAIKQSATSDDTPSAPTGDSAEERLGKDIVAALMGIENPPKRLKWRREFRKLLDCLEDELIEDMDNSALF